MSRTHRSLSLLVPLLLILSAILAACGAPEDQATAETVATQVPGAIEDVATEVADAGSQSSPTAAVSEYSARVNREKQETVDTSKYKADPPYTIASVAQGPFNGWGLTYDTAIKHTASEKDEIKDLIVANGDGDASKQIRALEDMIQRRPDAIVLQPLGRAALSAPVERAMREGIPVILCLNGVETENYVTRTDVDLYKVGYDAAKGMAEQMGGKGNVIIFSGIPGVDAAETWKQAAVDAISQYPDIKLVGNEYAEWSIATSKTKTAQLLSATPQIDGVFAGGSEMAIGAINAFKEAGKPMPVFGVANPLNGFLRLAIENDITFTGAPDPAGASSLCLENALKVLRGEPVQKFIDISGDMPGAQVYDQTKAKEYYKPQFNDDFVPPVVIPEKAVLDAGFGRK